MGSRPVGLNILQIRSALSGRNADHALVLGCPQDLFAAYRAGRDGGCCPAKAANALEPVDRQ